MNEDWTWEFPASITVTDADGVICVMNQASRETFKADGGATLIGTDVLACHPEPARTKTAELYQRRKPNHYTIQKAGQKKIIHQIPWYHEGVFAGFVEMAIPIPEDLPHFERG